MAVEEILMPVRTVGGVSDLGVDAHDCGKYLGKEENAKAGQERRVDLRGAGRGFALNNRSAPGLSSEKLTLTIDRP